jgi:aryl-alcohol dehydrogenase-like predicted oxidoreductase
MHRLNRRICTYWQDHVSGNREYELCKRRPSSLTQGVCRYIGITSTRHSDFGAIEAVLLRERPDFVQIDYSLDDREAEKRVLPAAAEVRNMGAILSEIFAERSARHRHDSPNRSHRCSASLSVILSPAPPAEVSS